METVISQSDIYVNLLVAMVLGMALGLERFFAHKTAGMRTYALISMGSALFVIISQVVTDSMVSVYEYDPLRIAAQIVAAAGFLGAGAILHRDGILTGITTASGLWAAAGVGMAAGFGLYSIAVAATVFILFIFVVLWLIESRVSKLPFRRGGEEDPL